MKAELFDDPSVLEWLRGFSRSAWISAILTACRSLSLVRTEDRCRLRENTRARIVRVKLHDSFDKFFRVAYNTNMLHSFGLPVPDLLSCLSRAILRSEEIHADRGAPRREELRYAFSGGKAQGPAWCCAALASLHSIKRRRCGWFLSPGFGSYTADYARRMVGRLRRFAHHADRGRVETLSRSIKERANAIGRRPAYELLHARVNPNNFLVADSGAGVIDLLTAHYGDFAARSREGA